MADIKAFRAWRYDLVKAGDAGNLASPPYDVIDPQMTAELYQASPYNIVRLEAGKAFAADDDKNNKYTRAAADFARWIEEGILIRDEKPAFYFYTQEFALKGENISRKGFLAVVRAEGYEGGQVLPHEETLPKHKADRYKLMEYTHANFSPILGLYAQENQSAVKALENQALKQKPDMEFIYPQGIMNRLWKIDDAAVIKQVEDELKPLKIYIADGHHRYETASLFARNAAARGESGCQYLMIALIDFADFGLRILPTHRLIKSMGNLSARDMLAAISKAGFTVSAINGGNKEQTLKILLNRMKEDGAHTHSFGLYADGSFYLLHLTENHRKNAVYPGKSAAYRNLDVSILHSLIIEGIFAIDAEKIAAEGYIGYTRKEQEIIEKVDSGEFACAFLLNGTAMTELSAVAEGGEKLPQKSTYFYPKIIAGLTVNTLKD